LLLIAGRSASCTAVCRASSFMCATHLLNRIFQSEAAISGKHRCPWSGMCFLKLSAYMIMSGSWRAG
jgi:hypothetical protein